MNDPKLMNDICILSRNGVCLMSMKQVAEQAKQMGMTRLAELVEGDLKENKIMDGKYAPLIAPFYGGAS